MFLELVCAIFDVSLWVLFYNGLLRDRKKEIPYIIFLLSYIVCEGILFAVSITLSTNYSDYRVLLNTFVSFALSFLLTFLYNCKLNHKFFCSLSFAAICLFSEFLIYQIVTLFPSEISDSFLSNQIYGAISAKIVSLLVCTVIIVLFRRKEEEYTLQYTSLILIMPVISLIILLTIPARTDLTTMQSSLSIIGMSGLLLANIINYYLLDNILRVQYLKQKEIQTNQQIQLQFNKYQQLSQAYRSSRSFIHDVKKQYLYIRECLNKNAISEISSFLEETLYNLDMTTTTVNTGNLVIDSFVSNHLGLANQAGIQFETKLQINPDKISISDYDLCLILGNLLDNSYQECHSIPNPSNGKIKVEIYTSSLELLIHITNTVNLSSNNSEHKQKNELLHGFGTATVDRITKKYHGTYTHKIEDNWYHAIVSIPYITNQP